METMTGLLFRASTTSRQITSDAVPEPPGLSTRRTMALMSSSLRASRRRRATVSEPATCPPKRPALALAGDDLADRVDERDLGPAVEAEPARLRATYRPGVSALASFSRSWSWSS